MLFEQHLRHPGFATKYSMSDCFFTKYSMIDSRDRAIYPKNRKKQSDSQINKNYIWHLGGGLDRPKMMAYGQLRFWAAGKLAYESEAWPQAFFFVSLHPFLEKQQKLDVSIKNRSKIDRIRRKSSKIVGKSLSNEIGICY